MKKSIRVIIISVISFLLVVVLTFFIMLLCYKPSRAKPIDLKEYESPAGSVAMDVEIKVTSFNIRCAMKEKIDENNWKNRKDRTIAHIKSLDSDIIGLQEARPGQLKYILKNVPEYVAVGESRDNYMMFSEKSAVLYKESVFELIETRTFWLSDTPNKPSKVEGAGLNRICTYAILRHRATNKMFIAANTHLDHVSEEVRKAQTEVLCELLKDAQLPIFITGDFNFKSTAPGYGLMTQYYNDASVTANQSSPNEYTFHAYNSTGSNKSYIDFIFVSRDIIVDSHSVDAYDIDGLPYSDHYSVTAALYI